MTITKQKKRGARDKDDRVHEAIEELKQQHGESAFTLMLWSEMIVSGMHSSYTPKSSMFQRVEGKETPNRKSESVAEMAAQVASQAIAYTLTPRATSSSLGASPGRVIENRSKCYRQLTGTEQSGVLSPEEYGNHIEDYAQYYF